LSPKGYYFFNLLREAKPTQKKNSQGETYKVVNRNLFKGGGYKGKLRPPKKQFLIRGPKGQLCSSPMNTCRRRGWYSICSCDAAKELSFG
jgi:hypothetical protein